MLLILRCCSIVVLILMLAIAIIKALIGFHWPWEKCECCGKKYREHKKETGPPLPIPLVKTKAFKKYMKEIEKSDPEKEFVNRPFKEGYRLPPEGSRLKIPLPPPKEEYRGFTVDGHKIDPHLHLLACAFLTEEQAKAIGEIMKTKPKNRMEGCV